MTQELYDKLYGAPVTATTQAPAQTRSSDFLKELPTWVTPQSTPSVATGAPAGYVANPIVGKEPIYLADSLAGAGITSAGTGWNNSAEVQNSINQSMAGWGSPVVQGNTAAPVAAVTPTTVKPVMGPANAVPASDTARIRDLALKTIALKESDNRPTRVNRLGYAGLYQVGADTLIDLGYLKPGGPKSKSGATVNSWMKQDSNWTDKAKAIGIDSFQAFLNSPKAQTAIMEQNYEKLRKMAQSPKYSAFTNRAGASKEEALAATVAAMHLLGPSGLLSKGLHGADANKTKGLTWYNHVLKAVKTR